MEVDSSLAGASCCLDLTGGSFAKTSRKIARKSRMVDF